MKNLVFIPNIKLGDNRNSSYDYSVNSWKHWCKKNDVELVVWEDLVFPVERMKITLQRYYLFDICEKNKVEFDQALIVDADTIIHPDCPNFFEETENKYCGVMNDGDYEWVSRSIRNYRDFMFKDEELLKPHQYINGGFQIVNQSHRQFFQDIVKFYWLHSDDFIEAQHTFKVGTDQTPLNYLLRKYEIDVKILPGCYNLQDLYRKNLLYIAEQCWWEDNLENLYNSGWIYHFNAIPPNPLKRDASYWMERVYKELYK